MLLRVLRYYGLLILPIALAFGAIARESWFCCAADARKPRSAGGAGPGQIRPAVRAVVVLRHGLRLDQPAFLRAVLPAPECLQRRAGRLSGRPVRLTGCRRTATRPAGWSWACSGLLAMIVMSWHIFFGIAKSPHSGMAVPGSQSASRHAQGIPAELAGDRKPTVEYAWDAGGQVHPAAFAADGHDLRLGLGSRASTSRPSG